MQRQVTSSAAVFFLFCACACMWLLRSSQEAGRKGCSGTAGPLEYCVRRGAGGGCGRDNGCWPDTPLSLQGPLSTFRLPAAPRQVHSTARPLEHARCFVLSCFVCSLILLWVSVMTFLSFMYSILRLSLLYLNCKSAFTRVKMV